MVDLCIYHGECIDGFTAAWAVRHAHPNAEFVPAGYGSEPPDVAGKDVLIVDFSYPREVLIAMNESASSLRVLDHHKTAQAALDGLPFAEFDMDRSGAGMAWDEIVGGERPWLVDYAEDRDLWRFVLAGSKRVNALIHTWPMATFADWDRLAATSRDDADNMGAVALMKVERYVSDMLTNAYDGSLPGHGPVRVVNTPFHHCSDVVGALASAAADGVGLGWWRRSDGKYQFSLRRRRRVDVSSIALMFGGGGHAGAAGFVLDELPAGLR